MWLWCWHIISEQMQFCRCSFCKTHCDWYRILLCLYFSQNLLTKPLYHIWLSPAVQDYISEVLLVLADTTLKLKALKHEILNTVQQVLFALRTLEMSNFAPTPSLNRNCPNYLIIPRSAVQQICFLMIHNTDASLIRVMQS